MKREVFRSFYNKTVCTLANNICTKNKGVTFFSNCDGLFEEYLNQRTFLKLLVKNMKDPPEEKLLDRHKVVACLTMAIMKTRLLHSDDFDDSDDYSLANASRINEQLAFNSGLNLLISYIREDPKTKSQEIKDSLDTFIFPKTRYENETEYSTYFDSIVRGLYYTNVSSGFSLLLISNIFFLLEEYHKLSCQKNLKNV